MAKATKTAKVTGVPEAPEAPKAQTSMSLDVKRKSFMDYFGIVKLPVTISILWGLLSAFAGLAPNIFGLQTLLAILTGGIGLLLGLALPLYVGWSAVKTYKFDLVNGAIAGGLFGLISGAVGGLINVLFAFLGLGLAMTGLGNMMGPAMFGGGLFIVIAIAGAIFGTVFVTIISAVLAAIGSFAAQSTAK